MTLCWWPCVGNFVLETLCWWPCVGDLVLVTLCWWMQCKWYYLMGWPITIKSCSWIDIIVLCDLVLCDLVLRDTMLCDLVLCDLVLCDLVLCDLVLCDLVLCDLVLCDLVKYHRRESIEQTWHMPSTDSQREREERERERPRNSRLAAYFSAPSNSHLNIDSEPAQLASAGAFIISEQISLTPATISIIKYSLKRPLHSQMRLPTHRGQQQQQ